MSRWKKLEGPGIGVVLGIAVFLLVHIALDRPIVPGTRRAYEPVQPPAPEMDPATLFSTNCSACHQANGQGLPGTFPPLAGSPWVLEDPETPVRVMMMGIQGPIEVNGTTYNGTMPSQAQLNDEQMAALATYIRSSFGNDAPAVDVATVQAVRAALSARSTPWNGGEELAAAREQP